MRRQAQAAAKAREQSNKLLGVPTDKRQAMEMAAAHYDKQQRGSISPLRAKMSNRALGLRPSTPPEDQPLSPRVLDLHPVDHRDNLRLDGRCFASGMVTEAARKEWASSTPHHISYEKWEQSLRERNLRAVGEVEPPLSEMIPPPRASPGRPFPKTGRGVPAPADEYSAHWPPPKVKPSSEVPLVDRTGHDMKLFGPATDAHPSFPRRKAPRRERWRRRRGCGRRRARAAARAMKVAEVESHAAQVAAVHMEATGPAAPPPPPPPRGLDVTTIRRSR